MAPHPLKNQTAPSFTLHNQNGEETTITPGSTSIPHVIFFYPASGTYLCTKEACAFRDAIKDVDVFKSTNVMVVGISGDTVEKQRKFVDQNGLPYPVLSDVNGEVRKAYHVKKGLLGLSGARVTFCIDSKGIVRDVLSSAISSDEHVRFATKCLTTLETSSQEAQEPTAEESTAPAPEPTAA